MKSQVGYWIVRYPLFLCFWVIPYCFLFAWVKYLGKVHSHNRSTVPTSSSPPTVACNGLSFSVPLVRTLDTCEVLRQRSCDFPGAFLCISLMISEVKHIHRLVNFIYSLFGEMSIESSAFILIGLFVFLLLNCRISWNMLDRHSRIQYRICNYFGLFLYVAFYFLDFCIES